MGSFLFTIGDAKIPKKRLDEFQRNILHVFDIGGMMQLEDASLFGKKVELMKPVEYEEASQTYWTCFNYFEQ